MKSIPLRKWYPRNPQKYEGDVNNIISRSSWETRCMNWFDTNPNVISWASEEMFVPYKSPVDGKMHRYFPDFLVRFKQKDGTTKVMMIEVKPEKQTKPPVKKSRVTKQYINEVVTWGTNEAKWKAATEYCLDRGWMFKVVTEYDLGIK